MNEASQFFIDHGLAVIFAVVFIEQIGLPVPALPWLLAAGAYAAKGEFNLVMGVGLTVVACLLADAPWFYLGRFRGTQVLRWLCRISLEPDSCVRRTRNVFTQYGLKGLIVAKFVPGLSTVAPPLAGMAGIDSIQFLLVDAVASLLYGGLLIGFGFLFSDQIIKIANAVTAAGRSAMLLLIGLCALYLAHKYWQRQRLLRELRTARITAGELRQKLEDGSNPVIVDLRPKVELNLNPLMIRGAIHVEVDKLENHVSEIPRDRDVIVYCSCPNEITSAHIALLFRRKGFTRIHPLQGGIEAWRKLNFPMETWAPGLTIAWGGHAFASNEKVEKQL